MSELDLHISVIGQGYVGLQLAVAFSKELPTTGFDIDEIRIRELNRGLDRYRELSRPELDAAGVSFTTSTAALIATDVFIVSVPTPVDANNVPDLTPLRSASRTIGEALRSRESRSNVPLIVYESTVYPGCTEEVCIPEIEDASGQSAGEGFVVGYSPERVNPGDTEHTLATVIKIVSGQSPEVAERVASLYRHVAKAGIHVAESIRVAEAAKVIENVQRDLNISLMNELALLFHSLELDSEAVLRAAGTKWNFLDFRPGMVGGHCIPVDPYYLTFKAQQIGYNPEIVLAGRRLNDSVPTEIANVAAHLLVASGRDLAKARVLVLGATYKEDVRDFRNTPIVSLVGRLTALGMSPVVFDPLADELNLAELKLQPAPNHSIDTRAAYDCVIVAVPHRQFRELSFAQYRELLDRRHHPGVLVDVKGAVANEGADDVLYWRL